MKQFGPPEAQQEVPVFGERTTFKVIAILSNGVRVLKLHIGEGTIDDSPDELDDDGESDGPDDFDDDEGSEPPPDSDGKQGLRP